MSKTKMGGLFIVDCFNRDGELKWSDRAYNKVVNQGLQHILNVTFDTETDKAGTWYVGLVADTEAIVVGDVMSTHAFAESTLYSQSTRPIFVDGRTNQTVNNSSGKATFSLNADGTTIGGAFLASSKTAGGTAGVLLCAAQFSGGKKTGDSGDSLQVTYTFVASDDTSS